MKNNVPEKLGKYEVRQEIGRGSMGVVYLGYDPYANRSVAIKLAFLDALNNPESGARYREMFFNEAYTAGQLKHPNIVSIRDADVDQEYCYIVMEYIEDGKTLKPYCNSSNLLPVKKVVEIIFKCAEALDYIHRQGVIHRDIKPSNILFSADQNVKIGDFSIAHVCDTDAIETQTEGTMGSPLYMSPDQLGEKPVSHQTDIYSLGVVMYELLTGHRPFYAKNFPRLVKKILNDEALPIMHYRPDMSPLLNEIVFKALEKNLQKRYQTGRDLAADLSNLFDHLKESADHITDEEKFNTMKQLKFFAEFSDPEIWIVLRASIWQNYDENSDIIIEGEIDDCFYIIADGTVEVIQGNGAIGILKKGDCFGEMGYLAKKKRTATIQSRGPTSLMKISSTMISQVSLHCQVLFLRVFLKTLIQRLSATTKRISSDG